MPRRADEIAELCCQHLGGSCEQLAKQITGGRVLAGFPTPRQHHCRAERHLRGY